MTARQREGLTPAVFQILLALADADRHGYAILKEVERRTEGEVRLRPGTLYRALTRMVELGLIEEVEGPGPGDDDERRIYYGLARQGREAAREEALRLAALVRSARMKEILHEGDLA